MLRPFEEKDWKHIPYWLQGETIVGFDPETGAILERSRKQYILLYKEERRFKSRWEKGVMISDVWALGWANRSLARILAAEAEATGKAKLERRDA